MLNTAQMQKAQQQVAALRGIGFSRSAAISMIARQLRKSLPTIDTSASDRRREELERQQRRSSSTPANGGSYLDSLKRKKGPVLRGKHGRPLSLTRYNIKHADGSVWSYEVKPNGALVVRPPTQFDTPTYTVEQWRELQSRIQNHITERSKAQKQPAKAEVKKEDNAMEKSSKLDRLIAQARKTPEKLPQKTLGMLNQHLAKTGQPLVTLAAPTRTWGTMPNIGDIAASREVAATNMAVVPVPKAGGMFSQVCVQAASQNGRATLNLTGHQRAAMGVGLDPATTPNLERMSLQDMKDAAKQQQMTTVNALRQKQGLPPL